MANGLSEFERGLLESMQNIANALPAVPPDVVASQLDAFGMLARLVGSYCQEPAVRLLRQTAGRCGDDKARREAILRAAEALEAWLPDSGGPASPAHDEEPGNAAPEPAPALAVMPEFSVQQLHAGMAVRVMRGFVDYDGERTTPGELLHLRASSYFPYDDGHTLTFQERVVRLSGNCADQEAVVRNRHNSYFEPVAEPEGMERSLAEIDVLWAALGLDGLEAGKAIRAEIEQCREWLASPAPRGPAPVCLTSPLAAALFPDQGRTYGLARLIAFLFAAGRTCRDA